MSDSEEGEDIVELDSPPPHVTRATVEYRSDMCKCHFTVNLENDILNNGLPLHTLASHLELICSNEDGGGCNAACTEMHNKQHSLSREYIAAFIRRNYKRITMVDGDTLNVDADKDIIELLSALVYPMCTVLANLNVDYILQSHSLMEYLRECGLDKTSTPIDVPTMIFMQSLGLFTPSEFKALQLDDAEYTDVINAFEHNYFTVNHTDVHGYIDQRRQIYKNWLDGWLGEATGMLNDIMHYLPRERCVTPE